MESLVEVEVVRFWRPGRERTLLVGGLARHCPREDNWRALEQAFSAFGLLYQVRVMVVDEVLPGDTTYAFVTFYSLSAARKARTAATDHRMAVGGRTVKVNFVSSVAAPAEVPLHWSKCQELANHYLGFNGWSVAITSLEEAPTDDTSSCCCYRCGVCVRVGGVEAGGGGEHRYPQEDGVEGRGAVIGRAKKAAYARACEDAFSKIALALLSNGKVCAHSIEAPGDDAMATDIPPIKMIEMPYQEEEDI